MASKFTKATKKKSKLRMAVHGPSGSGKTYTALSIAKHLGGRIAVIDTEVGSASKYSDVFDFDVLDIEPPFHPNKLIEAIKDAGNEGFENLIIDSMTHFYKGPGGLLELVDQEAKRNTKGNSFAAWKAIDPLYRKVMQTILESQCNVIFCSRAKQEYSQEEENGRKKIVKLGMAPEAREGMEYEADVEGMLNMEHDLIIGKTRCPGLDRGVFNRAGKEVADVLNKWLSDGVDVPKPVPPPVPSTPKAEEPSAEHVGLCDQFISELAEVSSREDLMALKARAEAALGRGKLFMVDFQRAFVERLKSFPKQAAPIADQPNVVSQ